MSENEQRAHDVLTREDRLVRGAAVVGLIALVLLVLLAINPRRTALAPNLDAKADCAPTVVERERRW